tara:strand:+ start:360 stop:794 length:435 start_codon:yes stop_codon:yes gene_type:complete
MPPKERTEYVKTEIFRLEALLQPSDPEFVFNLIGGLANALGVEAPDHKRIAMFYVPELQKFPPDILERASDEVFRSWEYNNFPRVAHFCSHADEMLSERQILLSETRKWLGPNVTTQKQGSASTRKLSGPKRISDCLPKSIKVD